MLKLDKNATLRVKNVPSFDMPEIEALVDLQTQITRELVDVEKRRETGGFETQEEYDHEYDAIKRQVKLSFGEPMSVLGDGGRSALGGLKHVSLALDSIRPMALAEAAQLLDLQSRRLSRVVSVEKRRIAGDYATQDEYEQAYDDAAREIVMERVSAD